MNPWRMYMTQQCKSLHWLLVTTFWLTPVLWVQSLDHPTCWHTLLGNFLKTMEPFPKLETFFNYLMSEGYHEYVQAGLFDFYERTILLLRNSKLLQNDSQAYIPLNVSNLHLLHKSWPRLKKYMAVVFSITKSRKRWHHVCQQLNERKYTSSVDNNLAARICPDVTKILVLKLPTILCVNFTFHFSSFFSHWSDPTLSWPTETNIDLLNSILTLVFSLGNSSWLNRGAIFHHCHQFPSSSLRRCCGRLVFSGLFSYLSRHTCYLTENKHPTATYRFDFRPYLYTLLRAHKDLFQPWSSVAVTYCASRGVVVHWTPVPCSVWYKPAFSQAYSSLRPKLLLLWTLVPVSVLSKPCSSRAGSCLLSWRVRLTTSFKSILVRDPYLLDLIRSWLNVRDPLLIASDLTLAHKVVVTSLVFVLSCYAICYLLHLIFAATYANWY